MDEQQCKWCKGLGYIPGENGYFPCEDCDTLGYVYVCSYCLGKFSITEMDPELEVCTECREQMERDKHV